MEVMSESTQQVAKDLHMPGSADLFFIPERVVQNDQDVRIGVEHRENIVQFARVGSGGEGGELSHQRGRTGNRQVVETDMKEGGTEWHAPFRADRSASKRVKYTQQDARADIIVVC
jgi:hypothetical protein